MGDPCPSGDGWVLVASKTDHEWPDDAQLGRLIAGRFGVVDVLGEGGMGAVYLAIQEPVRRYVALKCMLPALAADPETRARFFREARVVASLRDPCVVTLIDFGEDADGSLFQAFEFIDGRELTEVLHNEGPLEPARAVRLVLQMLGGLAEAHQVGVVHRDIKPENVMVAVDALGEERARMLDFGIARPVDADAGEALTRAGLVLGTPAYMSPEQAMNRPVDERSDLYSLGVVLFHMLTGDVPFEHLSPLELLRMHAQDTAPPAGTDGPLDDVVARALAKDQAARFQSAAEMAQALRRSVRDETVTRTAEMPAQVLPAEPPPGPSNTLPMVLGGLVFLLAGALFAVLLGR